ncbi:MAG: lipopolysaccharide biosynthesis protein RfbH [Patescibacteria group bacterium]|jgi:CDP-6-deoxy-D-xylo-4-hexulose-3-dehydrase
MTKAEKLKKEIFEKVKAYYQEAHNQPKKFVEGVSTVRYAGRVFDEKEILNLIDSSLEFWLTYGRYSKLFEEKLAKFLGRKWTFLVNSGSSANLLSLSALTSPLLRDRRLKKGDEVITLAAGFPTTVAPIIQNGAIPVFVDIDLKTCNIDVNYLKQALSEKTKAIMIAHTLGNPFNLRAVKNFCEINKLWLIEDNCDALGSTYEGKLTGTWGDIGTSSFYPAHHITMGEGGAVYTDNVILKKVILSLRDWGRDCWCDSGKENTCGARFSQQHGTLPFGYDHKYVYSHFGYNLKVTDMQAAIGCAQIDKLPMIIQKRKDNFNKLFEGLKSLQDYFYLPQATPNSDPSWFGFLLILKDKLLFTRKDLTTYLDEKHIQSRNLFAGNLVRQPLFQNLIPDKDFRVIGNLKNTDKVMNDAFWLGVYPGRKIDEIEYMIKTLKNFVSIYAK